MKVAARKSGLRQNSVPGEIKTMSIKGIKYFKFTHEVAEVDGFKKKYYLAAVMRKFDKPESLFYRL